MMIKQILNRTKNGIDYLYVSDYSHVLSILRNHTEFDVKQGTGIKNIFSNNTTFGNRCFFIERTDGTIVDISYTHALKPRTKIDDIKLSCRSAIKGIIKDFAIKNFNGICSVTGEKISKSELHVDHYDVDFITLFNEWICVLDVDYVHSLVNRDTDTMSFDTYFTDDDIIQSFINFHNENTNLRCVSKKFNLSRKKNG